MERQYVQPEELEHGEFAGPEDIQEESVDEVNIEEPIDEVDESSEEQEEHSKPKKKHNIGERLSEIQKEKYRALAEVDKLRSENERLRMMTDASTKTAMQHYDQAVTQRLQAARDLKAKALETGDIQAQVDADMALNMATNEYQNMLNLKAQSETFTQPHYQQQQQEPTQTGFDETSVIQFVEENPWFNPKSEEYDEELAGAVNHYCNAYDNILYRNGYGAYIGTPEYMRVVAQKSSEIRNHFNNQRHGGQIPMRPSRGTVSATRSRPGYSHTPQKTTLSAETRDMIRRLGVDEKTYIQHMMNDKKANPHKWK